MTMTIAIAVLWLGCSLGYYFADPERSVFSALLFLPLAVLSVFDITLAVAALGLLLLILKGIEKW